MKFLNSHTIPQTQQEVKRAN
uniref:Uncharacterized protein n=1 Tax=Rhizophora mucronata TaxID=61149 RepID=A0A2P2NCY6_RHIMU